MPSSSLQKWQVEGRRALDQVEAAHRAIGRKGPGARHAAEQINQAYVLLLSSRFQRFCRDLHSECVDHMVGAFPAVIRLMLRRQFLFGRKLDAGNPNPGNIGSDFDRFEISFWPAIIAYDADNQDRQRLLTTMNVWRNAIAHHDFSRSELTRGNYLRLTDVRVWRVGCERLAVDFERVMYQYLKATTGYAPW
jgi:hypothetical protein